MTLGPAIFCDFERSDGRGPVSILASKVQAVLPDDREPGCTLVVLDGGALTYSVRGPFEAVRDGIGISLGGMR